VRGNWREDSLTRNSETYITKVKEDFGNEAS
jgi:hypothetical protein